MAEPQTLSLMKKEFHHVGYATTTKHANEIYLADTKLYITDASQHPHRIEWLRFEPGCPLPDILRQVPHVAFAVDNLDEALKGHNVIVKPFVPLPGVRVAFILEEGQAPVEFLEFK